MDNLSKQCGHMSARKCVHHGDNGGITLRLRSETTCVTNHTDGVIEENTMPRDLESMCPASLVEAIRKEAFELGRMTADPKNFPGNTEKQSEKVHRLTREIKSRLAVPHIR